jgi:hypothetical protein
LYIAGFFVFDRGLVTTPVLGPVVELPGGAPGSAGRFGPLIVAVYPSCCRPAIFLPSHHLPASALETRRS